ncbi:MAG: archaeosortase C [Methanocellales archaeon]
MLFIFVLALFIGATVQYSEGSVFIGILLILIALLILTRIKLEREPEVKRSIYFPIAGVFIILADVAYNFYTSGELGTLDTMLIVLGASLVASYLKDAQFRKIGVFGVFMSLTFIVLFSIFFSLFNAFNIDLVHRFDHYFVMLPSAYAISSFGFPVEVVGVETLRIYGVETLTVVIGGPCSGLYSMFLLASLVFAYFIAEKISFSEMRFPLLLAIGIAYFSNLVRVSIIYLVGHYYGEEAMMTAHVHSGWIIFIAMAGAIMWLIKGMEKKKS